MYSHMTLLQCQKGQVAFFQLSLLQHREMTKGIASVNLDFRLSFQIVQLSSCHAQSEEMSIEKGQTDELSPLSAQVVSRPWETTVATQLQHKLQTSLGCLFMPAPGLKGGQIIRVYLALLSIFLSKAMKVPAQGSKEEAVRWP